LHVEASRIEALYGDLRNDLKYDSGNIVFGLTVTSLRSLSSARFLRALLAACIAAVCMHALAYTTDDYKRAIGLCLKSHDYACAQKNYEQYLKLRPDDTTMITNLGQVMAWQDNLTGAIQQYEKAIDLGEGAYNLFAYYADALGKTGRIDEAIDWSYRSLAAVPSQLDVRSNLAKLLVHQKRYYEALALLSGYDDVLVARGEPAYFAAQRIAIESVIERYDSVSTNIESSLRLPKVEKFFVAPVTVGDARPTSFLIDTGANVVVVNDNFLNTAKVKYTSNGTLTTTGFDGRVATAHRLIIASLRVGPFELKNVSAVSCPTCALLLGQTALEKFDMKSSRVQGVEFMTLSPRKM
jgi:tetratricopeptide (TPR) repeat protein